MNSQDYPIQHFKEMNLLATNLTGLPAQVLEHHYSYESFGSWATIIRYKGYPLRICFDGKERQYILERSASRQAPYSWKAIWHHAEVSGETAPLLAVLEAIRSEEGAG
jgi:hypothetical protein